MKRSLNSLRGFTLIELLVVIAIIALLASLSIPAVGGAIVKAQLAQAVSNARQLNIATTGASADGSAQNDTEIGWPADLTPVAATEGDFLSSLGKGGYLKFGDLKVAGAGKMVYDGSGTFVPANHFGFYVYPVSDTADASDTVFLLTKNAVLNTGTNGATVAFDTAAAGYAKTFASKGFVVFRKGGDGTYILKEDATKVLGAEPVAGITPLTPDASGFNKATFEGTATTP